MKVLSLFDGMACGMLAMLRAGVHVGRYVAFEIDKYAVQTSTHNFPTIEHRGDVFHADFTEFRDFDFLVGGSPCTYWSIAQKNNRETEASGIGWELFSQYVRALREAQPMYFIYENNKSMSKAIRESITETFGFEPVCINSALVSAQSRQRLYWVGKRNEDGTYCPVDIEQPEDRGILLRDVLDGMSWREKAPILTASYCHKGCGEGSLASEAFPDSPHKQVSSYAAEPVCVAQRGRYTEDGIEQHFEARADGKTNTLTTVQKDNNICEPVCVGAFPINTSPDGKAQCVRATCYKDYVRNIIGNDFDRKTGVAELVCCCAIPCEWDENGKPTKARSAADGKIYAVYEVKDGQITIKDKSHPIKLPDGFYIIRKLTVSECKRLQTVPEWYEFPVSDSQAYKMLGNGWTVEVIRHLVMAALGLEEEDDSWML